MQIGISIAKSGYRRSLHTLTTGVCRIPPQHMRRFTGQNYFSAYLSPRFTQIHPDSLRFTQIHRLSLDSLAFTEPSLRETTLLSFHCPSLDLHHLSLRSHSLLSSSFIAHASFAHRPLTARSLLAHCKPSTTLLGIGRLAWPSSFLR